MYVIHALIGCIMYFRISLIRSLPSALNLRFILNAIVQISKPSRVNIGLIIGGRKKNAHKGT